MTALAITAIGVAKKEELKFGRATEGDKFILLGRPQVGNEVDLESIGYYSDIQRLLQLQGIKEIVPVGSKGIAYEAQTLAALNKMTFKPHETEIDYNKSAGPATCLLILCTPPSADQILSTHPQSTIIGEI